MNEIRKPAKPTKIVSMRFYEDSRLDALMLRQLNEVKICDGIFESTKLSNRLWSILGMVLGVIRMSGAIRDHLLYVIRTQEERFPEGRGKEWPCMPEPQEAPELQEAKLAMPRLRLVK